VTPKFVRGGERPKPRAGVVVATRPYELHGTRYYAMLFRFADDPPDGAREARLSSDMIYDDPHPGDAILIESIAGVVDRITKDAEPRG
jgi:hypothetical protein